MWPLCDHLMPPPPRDRECFWPSPWESGWGKSTRKHSRALANTREHLRALASARECLRVLASAFDPPPERGGWGKSTCKHSRALANTRKHSRALASPRECLRVLLTLPLRGAAGAAGHLESWVTCWNMRSNLCFIAAILISSRLPVMVFFGGLVTCVPTLCPNPLSSSSAIFWKFEVAKNGKTYYTKPLGIF